MAQSILELLEKRGGNSALVFGDSKPGVLLVVGVNGGGKTTTIGKLAHKFTGEGATVRSFICESMSSAASAAWCDLTCRKPQPPWVSAAVSGVILLFDSRQQRFVDG